MSNQLEISEVSKAFGGVQAVARVSLDVRQGEILSVIGPNGAGKTTLLNMISGFYHPDSGRIMLEAADITHVKPNRVAELGVARTFQNIALFRGMTVLDNIMTGRNLKMKTNLLQQAFRLPFGWSRRSARRSSSAASSNASSTSSRSSPIARRRWARCRTAYKSASTSAARWRWSRACCCSTSRWPA